MIIVLLLFFQSLCLYLQNIVLTVHDKWLNPRHARLLIDKEQQRLQLFALKPKHPVQGCSFCSNSPLGYCRHHNPNQPTLRHLKNRLIARGCRTAATVRGAEGGGGGGGGGGGVGGEQQQQQQGALGGSCSSLSSSVEGGTLVGKTRPNLAKLCACLSCAHGELRNTTRESGFRRNRTSWGTRNGNRFYGEPLRVVTNNQCHGRFIEDNETGVTTTTRRGRRCIRPVKN